MTILKAPKADVCLILEGTYPYVSGGVATWTHELIQRQSHLTFHLVSIMPRDAEPELIYALPPNVTGMTTIHLQKLPTGLKRSREFAEDVAPKLKRPLSALTSQSGHLRDFTELVRLVERIPSIGSGLLLDSEQSWDVLVSMYEEYFPESSFLDYFWSWRALMGSLCSLLLAPLPEARVYHAMSTGYAGLIAARAKIETGRPMIITEHGIYTNERRIEVASAGWLDETSTRALTIDKVRRDLRDFWIDAFTTYSRIAYEAADRIVTLFEGNQTAQLADGADPAKLQIICNGVDLEQFSRVQHKDQGHPTIALIGRVVPIKDIKSFIRTVAILHRNLPDLKAYIIGPTDEDEEYTAECRAMVEHLGLEKTLTFTGKVNIMDYLPQIDVIALTSISEAQPLVVQEAAAAGIPTVATDVGACRELILGKPDETPYLGEGGFITPLSNPTACAEAIYALLTDKERYAAASAAARARMAKYYDKKDQHAAYRALYEHYLQAAKAAA